MVQSRLPLLEKALAGALGSGRQLVLEAGDREPATLAESVVPVPRSAPAEVAEAPLEMKVGIRQDGDLIEENGALTYSSLEEKAKRLADFFNGEVIAEKADEAA
jgi:DNA polymerase-3 subunit gamma/tau